MTWPTSPLETLRAPARHSFVGGPFGSNLTTRDYVDEGVPVIRGSNLAEDQLFKDADFVYVRETKADELRSNLAYPGDVIFTQRGTIGQVGVVPLDARFPRYVLSQSQMKLTVDPDLADARFIYYFFKVPTTVQTLVNLTATSGVPHINLGTLKQFEVPTPKLTVQKKIVDRLAAYDDLIANNRRRMVLLEEAAQQLYREWFVRLRFPGHEHTRFAEGVPEGWVRAELAAVCVSDGIQTGPFGSQLHQSDYSDTGVPVVMPKDLIDYRISVEKIARIPDDLANRLGRHRMITGDTVYGRRGDIGRRGFIGEKQAGFFCGTGCLRIRPDASKINPRYLFDALGAPETAGTIANRAKGATMLNLNASVLRTVPVLVPPRVLQDLFADHVLPASTLIEVLSEQNGKLRAARDLLLPRLMSGEIAV